MGVLLTFSAFNKILTSILITSVENLSLGGIIRVAVSYGVYYKESAPFFAIILFCTKAV